VLARAVSCWGILAGFKDAQEAGEALLVLHHNVIIPTAFGGTEPIPLLLRRKPKSSGIWLGCLRCVCETCVSVH
jgi:hypothetical protein